MPIRIPFGTPNPKQEAFFRAKNRFIAYGGARGGGKSWALRKKAMLLGCRYPGIRMLLIRRSFPELRENHIFPLIGELSGIANYKADDKTFRFTNGSRLVLGYCANEHDVDQYQGQEYDIIFIDEATHFPERVFSVLTACLRGVNDFPKRMYLTCNPGGVGHAWVKRLFVDREYRATENPEDYAFIQARVYDNTALLKNGGDAYVKMLENLPDGLRQAWLDGDWSVLAGQYFNEFSEGVHVCAPFVIPEHWRKYISFDYGLDMLAAYLFAMDEQGRAYVVREVYEGRDLGEGAQGLIISDAASRVLELAGGLKVEAWLAPPDLWSSRQETGKSVADIFAENGILLTKTSNDRIDGWMAVKEWLRLEGEGEERVPRLQIFNCCKNLIRTLPLLQHDEKKVNDVATEPHEITHAPDALRGFCVYWTRAAGTETLKKTAWRPDMWEDFYNADKEGRAYLLRKWGNPQ